jgi:hypothetical protein
MSRYDEVLDEARKKGEILANKYIFELYCILRDDEHLPPEDCRAKIEHDCMDLWSKATIRKFLPDEAKNPKKSKAGKIGAEQKMKLKESQVIEKTTDGIRVETDPSAARIDPAENNSFDQEKEESRRFHNELKQHLEGRIPSPELLQATKVISEKDQRITELEDLISNRQINPQLYLPDKFAQEIHDTVDINRSAGKSKIDFILRHNRDCIIAVESLSSLDSNSEERMEPY